MDVRRIKLIEKLYGLWIALVCLVIEAVLLLNVLKVFSKPLNCILGDRLTLMTLILFVTTAIFVPAFLAQIDSLHSEVLAIYRKYLPRALSRMSVKNIRRTILLFLILVPLTSVAITIAVASRIPILCIVCVIPVLIFALLLLMPIVLVRIHAAAVDRELLWFAIMLSIVESAGANISFVIKKLKEAPILKWISKEVIAIDRDSKLYFSSCIDAVMHRASVTPNERLARLFAGYASKIRSGGDVVSWLRAWISEELMRIEFQYRLFSERMAVVVGQLALAVYAFIPLVMAALSYLSSLSILMIVPVAATPAMVLMAYAIRPSIAERPSLRPCIIPLLALVSISILLWTYLGWMSIAVGWAVAIILSVNSYRRAVTAFRLGREGLELLRDVAELQHSGYTVLSALRMLSSSTKFTRDMREVLQGAVNLMEKGESLTAIACRYKNRSSTLSYILYVLGLIHECGSMSSEAIYSFYEVMRRIVALEDSVKKISFIFDAFAIANGFVVVWVKNVVEKMSVYASLAGSIVTFTSPCTAMLISLITISMLGYSLVSSTIRIGIPIFEPRQTVFLLLSTVLSILAM